MNIQEIRQQYPQYNDLSDTELADGFHSKFYSDIPKEQFYTQLGIQQRRQEEPGLLDQAKQWFTDGKHADRAVAVGENLTNLASMPFGMFAGGVEGLQGIIDSVGDGTFGTQKGVQHATERFHKGMEEYTYQPKLNETSKEMANLSGRFFNDVVIPVAPVLHGMPVNVQGVKTQAGSVLDNLTAKRVERANVSELSAGEKMLQEKRKQQQTKTTPEQQELALEYPNQFGQRPSDFTVDENGIPIRKEATLDAQTTTRQGDLFEPERITNEGIQDNLNRWEPSEDVRSVAPDREYLKQQEVEQAYLDRNKGQIGFDFKEPEARPDTSTKQQGPVTRKAAMEALRKKQGGAINPAVFAEGLQKLDKFVSEEIIDRLKNPPKWKSRERLVLMPVDEFLTLAKTGHSDLKEAGVKNWFESGGKIDDLSHVPWLRVDSVGKITGHEGRHRVRYLKEQGIEYVPVRFESSNIRWSQQHEVGNVFDYVKDYPERVVNEDGNKTSPFPIPREEANLPNAGVYPNRPLGQTRMGKGQSGAWTPFSSSKKNSSPSFEEYHRRLKDKFGEVSVEDARSAYKIDYPEENVGGSVTQNNSAPQRFSLAQQIDGSILSPEQVIEKAKGVPDLERPNILTQKAMSSGRLQRNMMNHPITDQIYNFTTKAIEDARSAARNVLDDVKNGLIPQVRKAVLVGEWEALNEYRKWRFANEGLDTALPESFSRRIKEFHERLTKEKRTLLDGMNAELAKDGIKPIQDILNHMVHYWRGPYRAYINIPTASGKRLGWFIAEKSKGDAEKAVAWIKKEFPEYEVTDINFIPQYTRTRSAMFDHLLELSKLKDETVATALDAFLQRIGESQSRHMGEQHRQDYRAGVKGYLGEKPWLSEKANYADWMDSIRNTFDAGYQWIAAQQIRRQMKPILDAQKAKEINTPVAIEFGQKYIDHALGKNAETSAFTKGLDWFENESRAFGPSRRFLSETNSVLDKVVIAQLLGFLKGTSILQNLVQPSMILPKMLELSGKMGTNPATIPYYFARGALDGIFTLGEIVSLGTSRKLVDAISSPEGKAIREYMDKHDISRMSLVDTRSMFKEGGAGKTVANITTDAILNTLTSIAEGPTRSWSFSAMARKLMHDGIPKDQALRIAHEQMDVMTNYNPEAAAMMFDSFGRLGQEGKGLHTYMINYYSQLALYTRDAVLGLKNKKPAEALPLITFMAQAYVLAGLFGLLPTNAVEGVLDGMKWAAQKIGYDSRKFQEFSFRKWLLENYPEQSVGMFSTTTGLSMYGALDNKMTDPDRSLFDTLFPKTIAKGKLFANLVQTPKLASENTRDIERSSILEGVAPKSMTQAIRGKYVVKDGLVHDRQHGLPDFQRTEKEQKIAKWGFGLRGLAEGMNQEDSIQVNKAERNVTESTKAKQDSLDNLINEIGKYGQVTPAQKAQMEKLTTELVNEWGVNHTSLQNHIQEQAKLYGIKGRTLRELMQLRIINSGAAARKADEKTNLLQRMKERQERYGR